MADHKSLAPHQCSSPLKTWFQSPSIAAPTTNGFWIRSLLVNHPLFHILDLCTMVYDYERSSPLVVSCHVHELETKISYLPLVEHQCATEMAQQHVQRIPWSGTSVFVDSTTRSAYQLLLSPCSQVTVTNVLTAETIGTIFDTLYLLSYDRIIPPDEGIAIDENVPIHYIFSRHWARQVSEKLTKDNKRLVIDKSIVTSVGQLACIVGSVSFLVRNASPHAEYLVRLPIDDSPIVWIQLPYGSFGCEMVTVPDSSHLYLVYHDCVFGIIHGLMNSGTDRLSILAVRDTYCETVHDLVIDSSKRIQCIRAVGHHLLVFYQDFTTLNLCQIQLWSFTRTQSPCEYGQLLPLPSFASCMCNKLVRDNRYVIVVSDHAPFQAEQLDLLPFFHPDSPTQPSSTQSVAKSLYPVNVTPQWLSLNEINPCLASSLHRDESLHLVQQSDML